MFTYTVYDTNEHIISERWDDCQNTVNKEILEYIDYILAVTVTALSP